MGFQLPVPQLVWCRPDFSHQHVMATGSLRFNPSRTSMDGSRTSLGALDPTGGRRLPDRWRCCPSWQMKGLGNDSLIKKCLNPGSHWNPGRGAGGHSHFFVFLHVFLPFYEFVFKWVGKKPPPIVTVFN